MKTGSDIGMATRIVATVAIALGALVGSSAIQAQQPPPFGLAPAPAAQTPTPNTAAPAQVRSRPAGTLYIAGDGFSLDQSVDDGLRESLGSPFAVLVLGAEISKLGIHGISSEVSSVLVRAFNGGASLYVCERDVKRLNFSPADFVPGVEVVRGFNSTEAQSSAPAAPGAVPLAPIFRMRQVCAE